jgi:histone deacetylase 11
VHQGNGHEQAKKDDENVFIMDIYNYWIYPNSIETKKYIDVDIGISYGYEDEDYLQKVDDGLKRSFEKFKPDFIIYNAGTDILAGDPLGGVNITKEGIIQRDEKVFRKARENNIPILMLLSGGYQKETAKVIVGSLINLKKNRLLNFKI